MTKIKVGDNVEILYPHVFAGNRGVVKEFSTKPEDAYYPWRVEVTNDRGTSYIVGCNETHLEVIDGK